MGVSPRDGQLIEEPIETVEHLMNQLAQTDMVVASRFHGVLLSLLLEKPVIALSYHSKIDELMKDTGQADYCLSIDHFETETMQQLYLQIRADSLKIRDQIAKRVGEYRAALDDQYRRIFAN